MGDKVANRLRQLEAVSERIALLRHELRQLEEMRAQLREHLREVVAEIGATAIAEGNELDNLVVLRPFRRVDSREVRDTLDFARTAKQPITAAQVAERFGINTDAAALRLSRMAAKGFLTRVSRGRYTLNGSTTTSESVAGE